MIGLLVIIIQLHNLIKFFEVRKKNFVVEDQSFESRFSSSKLNALNFLSLKNPYFQSIMSSKLLFCTISKNNPWFLDFGVKNLSLDIIKRFIVTEKRLISATNIFSIQNWEAQPFSWFSLYSEKNISQHDQPHDFAAVLLFL